MPRKIKRRSTDNTLANLVARLPRHVPEVPKPQPVPLDEGELRALVQNIYDSLPGMEWRTETEVEDQRVSRMFHGNNEDAGWVVMISEFYRLDEQGERTGEFGYDGIAADRMGKFQVRITPIAAHAAALAQAT